MKGIKVLGLILVTIALVKGRSLPRFISLAFMVVISRTTLGTGKMTVEKIIISVCCKV